MPCKIEDADDRRKEKESRFLFSSHVTIDRHATFNDHRSGLPRFQAYNSRQPAIYTCKCLSLKMSELQKDTTKMSCNMSKTLTVNCNITYIRAAAAKHLLINRHIPCSLSMPDNHIWYCHTRPRPRPCAWHSHAACQVCPCTFTIICSPTYIPYDICRP